MSAEQLTPEQEAQIEPYRKKWFDIGTNCDPLDVNKAVDAVARAYKAGGLEPPKFHFAAASPISGAIAGVCVQRYFRGLESDLRDPKILDQPFLAAAERCVDELPRELETLAKTGESSTAILDTMIGEAPVIPTLEEYVEEHHNKVVAAGGKLPLKLPEVAEDMRQQLALQLVNETETTNDGPLPDGPKAPKSGKLPTELAPLGKSNGPRFMALVAMVLHLVQKQLTPTTAKKFANFERELALVIHRRIRRVLHQWLLEKIEVVKQRDLPKGKTGEHEIDEEFARACQQQFSDQANGNHDTSWSCYYDFLLNVCGVQEVKPLEGLLDLAKSCGWWTPLRWVAILQHRPAELHCDAEGRLHRDGGMVVRFRDSFGFWILHGVPVPKEIAETPAEKLDPKLVLETPNADVRREILRKIGMEVYIHKMGAKTIHAETEYRDLEGFLVIKRGEKFFVQSADGEREIDAKHVRDINYELIEFQVGGDNRTARALKMNNPSVAEVWHVECVPVTCQTVQDAINFRNHLTPEEIDEKDGAWTLQQGDVLLRPDGQTKFKPRPLQLT